MWHPRCFLLLNSVFHFATLTVFPFILKSSVWSRGKQSCCLISHSHVSALHDFAYGEKHQGAGLGIAHIFSPASSPWPHVNLVLVQAKMSVSASNNVVSSITRSCVFKGAKGQEVYLLTVYMLVTTRIGSFKDFPGVACPCCSALTQTQH